ncbi:MAG TPA: hypothetical protein VM243_14445, partial [Phycisphaerae bacterium]|nr:hypothetical protein [Phycisphaerae bacterium]
MMNPGGYNQGWGGPQWGGGGGGGMPWGGDMDGFEEYMRMMQAWQEFYGGWGKDPAAVDEVVDDPALTPVQRDLNLGNSGAEALARIGGDVLKPIGGGGDGDVLKPIGGGGDDTLGPGDPGFTYSLSGGDILKPIGGGGDVLKPIGGGGGNDTLTGIGGGGGNDTLTGIGGAP